MIFAFGHRRYVGKDTAGRFLINHIRMNHGGLQVKKVSFATPLKEQCYKLFRNYGAKPPKYYEKHPNEKDVVIPMLGRSMREIWIKYGNDVRAIYPLTWVDLALIHDSNNILLITDLRYINEAEAIKKRGGVLIRIDRDDIPQHDDIADSNLASYNDWDYIIKNNDDLNYLHRTVVRIVDDRLTKTV